MFHLVHTILYLVLKIWYSIVNNIARFCWIQNAKVDLISFFMFCSNRIFNHFRALSGACAISYFKLIHSKEEVGKKSSHTILNTTILGLHKRKCMEINRFSVLTKLLWIWNPLNFHEFSPSSSLFESNLIRSSRKASATELFCLNNFRKASGCRLKLVYEITCEYKFFQDRIQMSETNVRRIWQLTDVCILSVDVLHSHSLSQIRIVFVVYLDNIWAQL